ncbi:UNVERIFIED_CONTAM: Eukaryotic translation initiation factor 4B2 [Sesamum radiatum]|uniref:Eukaryotic translation initiation factor 4B2 n=1 Tax=Sesamum radiatum TaxID=300843 RepID=A0AAW2RZ39_SESRA
MSKSPWGNIGAWAAEAERAEEEEREAAEKAAAAQPPASFPSLKESVTTATKQKKKTKMTLQEFTMQQSSNSGSAASRGLTPEEMLRLPTGPKERSPDEMQFGRLGGGFSNYGNRPGSGGARPREYEGRRSYGFQDEDRRGGPPQVRVSEMNQPSRADGVDNWASMKKQTIPEYNSPQARPGGKYSSLGGGGGPGVGSRADEVDNWASVKKPISQPQQQGRSSTFGSGFSRPEPDRWARNEQRLVSDSPKIEVEEVAKVNKPNPFGAARPREEVLAEKGLDWKKLDSEIEGKKLQHSGSGSRPSSSQSSRPGSPLSSKSEVTASLMPGMGEGAVKQKPKVNPFGDAKPREVLLEEKGLDWKKIDLDLEHRRVERCLSGKILASTVLLKFDDTCAGLGPETEEEKNLKEEIEHLKKELLLKSGDDKTSMHDLILQREGELELLVRQLDDKVRYSQKNFERPGSGAGRGAGFNERPPSRPGANEEPRAGFNDRPPSMPGAYEEPRAAYTERPRSRPGTYEDPRQERPPSWGGQYEDPRSGFAERPRSRPGAYEDPRPGSHERPRSRQGAYEDPRGSFPQRSSFTPGGYQEPRAVDYNERPRSRGTTNSWTRSSDDRRAIQGGGGRGFLGNRDVDRYFFVPFIFICFRFLLTLNFYMGNLVY